MDIVTLIGVGAAICSMTSFIPQAWKIARSGETRDVSRRMYLLSVTGFGLWITYGVMNSDWPIIVTNCVCGLLSLFILGMTLVSHETREKIKEAT